MLKKEIKSAGGVYEIRDIVSDEAIVPQFCSKTEENARRQFAIFLSQNKLKSSDFELNLIGFYNHVGERVCRGSEVFIADYMKDDFEENVDNNVKE